MQLLLTNSTFTLLKGRILVVNSTRNTKAANPNMSVECCSTTSWYVTGFGANSKRLLNKYGLILVDAV